MYYWLLPAFKHSIEAGDEHKLATEIRSVTLQVMKVKRRDVVPHDRRKYQAGRTPSKIADARMYIAYLIARHTTFTHADIASYIGAHRTTVTLAVNRMRKDHLNDERVIQKIALIESLVFKRKPDHE